MPVPTSRPIAESTLCEVEMVGFGDRPDRKLVSPPPQKGGGQERVDRLQQENTTYEFKLIGKSPVA